MAGIAVAGDDFVAGSGGAAETSGLLGTLSVGNAYVGTSSVGNAVPRCTVGSSGATNGRTTGKRYDRTRANIPVTRMARPTGPRLNPSILGSESAKALVVGSLMSCSPRTLPGPHGRKLHESVTATWHL